MYADTLRCWHMSAFFCRHADCSMSSKGETEQIERVQRQAARWAKGEYGMTNVTRLLKELGWQNLADRRRHHRLTLLYKILNNHLTVPPEEVSIARASRPARSPATPSSCNDYAPVASHPPPCERATSSALFPSGIAYLLPQQRLIHT